MNKMNLRNHDEKFAVTSNLVVICKPIKQEFAFSDYKFPDNFVSSKGKYDTSKKTVSIGGAKFIYRTNNDYELHGKMLKKIYVDRGKCNPKKSNLGKPQCNDSSKDDKIESNTNTFLKYDSSKVVRKEFQYKKERKFQPIDVFRIRPLESLDYDTDCSDDDDEGGMWQKPQVQSLKFGIDLEKKVDKLLNKIEKLEEKINENNENDTKQIRSSIDQQILIMQDNHNQLGVALNMLNGKLSILDEKYKPKVQGLVLSTINSVRSVNNMVAYVDENRLVERSVRTVETMETVLGPLSKLLELGRKALELVMSTIDRIVAFFLEIFPTIKEWFVCIKDSLSIHYLMTFLSSFLNSYEDWSVLHYVSLIIMIVSQYANNARYKDILLSVISYYTTTSLFNTATKCIKERYRVQSKDSYVLPFATCLGATLVASTGKGFSVDFFNAIKGFGGTLAFATKFDLLLKNIFSVIPDVVKEYAQYYCPVAYEAIQLVWFDEEFKKDYDNLQLMIEHPNDIYYSSHKLKTFMELYEKMRDVYLPKYGAYKIFQNSPIIERSDLIQREIQRRGLKPGRRHCPFVIWLGGDSGVGKSSFAQYLAEQFIDPEIPYNKQVYNWNPVLEYQDGYNNQPIVILNDYMQTTDKGEEQILISMKDACDWFLNMSGIDNDEMGRKGEVRFTSKMIIITSNILHMFQSSFIRDITAFNRRRDLLISMGFNGKKKFDHENVDYSWCDFAIVDPIVNKGFKPLSKDDLLNTIKDGYEKHMRISMNRVINGLRVQADESLTDVIKRRLEVAKNWSSNFVKTYYKELLASTTILGVGIWVILKFCFGKVITQAFNSGDEITIVKVHPKITNRLNRPKIQSSELVDQDAILNKIGSNLFRATICINVNGKSAIRSVTAIYIGADRLLLPKHFFSYGTADAQEGDMILINRGDLIFETTYEAKRRLNDSTDYCFYDVSLIMPRMKNIIKHFDKGIEPLSNNIDLIALRLNYDGVDLSLHNFVGKFIDTVTCSDGEGISERNYVGNCMLRFKSQLRTGDCGTPLISKIGGNYKVLGIHVGGTDSVQFAQLVDVRRFDCNIGPIEVQGMVETMDFSHGKGQFWIGRNVQPNAFPYMNSKTAIKPSICYEVLQPHITEPCVLSIHDPRNPENISMLHEATIQSGKIMNPISVKDFPEILQYMRVQHRCMYGLKYDVLSLHDAINGIEGLDRLDFSTSPGYPYTIGKIKKMDLFCFNDGIWYPTPLFETEFHNFIEQTKEKGMQIIWTNCVKDERRPIEKILKSRVFTISNILLTVLGRQLLGRFVSAYVAKRILHGGCVGINPYSHEWNEIYQNLSKYRKANDGDYSKYDKDLLKECYQLALCFIKEIIPEVTVYGKSNHWWIQEIMQAVVFSERLTILDGKKVTVVSTHGNPSGWFFTVFINDLSNKMYMYFSWMKLVQVENRVQSYINNVVLYCYGDDNIYTVSDEYCSIFNASTISDLLKKELNITYTSGDKTNVVSFNKDLMQCTFLKNHFVLHYTGIMVAGLERSVIQEMVSWTKDNDKSLDMILNTALRFSYYWGVEYFRTNYSRLRQFSNNLLTYEELDYEFQQNDCLKFEYYEMSERKNYENLLSKLSIVANSNYTSAKVQAESVISTDGMRDDATARATMRNFGVSMVNQNVVSEKSAYNNPSQSVQIPEVASTLKKLLSRPVLVGNIEVSAGSNGNVERYEFPRDWVNASKSINDIRDTYFFFKGKVKMQVSLQSTPYNSGAMVAHISYKQTSSFQNNELSDTNNAWIRPHVELDYSDNGVNKIMDIPWKYKKEYCDFSAVYGDAMCDIYCDNYIPNNKSARLLVYMWIEDVDVVVTRIGRSVRASNESKSDKPKVMGLISFGDNITNVIHNNQIKTVEGNIMPSNLIGDQYEMSNDVKLSAMDQPNITVAPMHQLMKREGTSSNAQQIQQMERICMYPGEQLMSTFETFGCDEDEMSIDYLKQKWSRFTMTSGHREMVYKIDTAPYTVLGATMVGPYASSQTYPGSTRVDSVDVSFLDYISRHHTFWRGTRGKDGSIEYRFKVGSNRFQSGRIAICYNPGSTWIEVFGETTANLVFSKDDLGACYVAYFDINGAQNEIVVRLPYVSATPWKTVWAGSGGFTMLSNFQMNEEIRASFNGVLVVLAVTPLVSIDGSPTSVTLVPFVRGAPGYEIASFSLRNNGIGKPTPAPNSSQKEVEKKTSLLDSALNTHVEKQKTRSNGNDNLLISKLNAFKVQAKTRKTMEVDCWEMLRRLIRMPRVKFELPYYIEDEENEHIKDDKDIKVQAYVFLGDDHEGKNSDKDMISTKSIRDICKRFVPYSLTTISPVAYLLNSDYDESPSGTFFQHTVRVGADIILPILPISTFDDYDKNYGTVTRWPSWMNWGGMYQGYRGGMKMRIRASIQKNGSTPDDHMQRRTNEDFRLIVAVDETRIGRYSANVYDINREHFTNIYNQQAPYRDNVETMEYRMSQDIGTIVMEANISGDVCLDFEIPAHLYNKYHEIIDAERNTTINPVLESRPCLNVFVYTDTCVSTPQTIRKIEEIVQLKGFRNAYSDNIIKIETWLSISDEGRFGVLDQYPSTISFGTDWYYSIAGRLPHPSDAGVSPTVNN